MWKVSESLSFTADRGTQGLLSCIKAEEKKSDLSFRVCTVVKSRKDLQQDRQNEGVELRR